MISENIRTPGEKKKERKRTNQHVTRAPNSQPPLTNHTLRNQAMLRVIERTKLPFSTSAHIINHERVATT